jgi:surfactin synthase thioesterase subunit
MCEEKDSALMLERWPAVLPDWIVFVPVRVQTPLAERRDDEGEGEGEAGIASDALERIFAYVVARLKPQGRYVVFGHRAGCLLALKLAYKIVASGRSGPSHLFLSGANAPHVVSSGFSAGEAAWEPLPCRLSVLSGKRDSEVMTDRLGEWGRYVRQRCDIHLLGGGTGWKDYLEELVHSCAAILKREYVR